MAGPLSVVVYVVTSRNSWNEKTSHGLRAHNVSDTRRDLLSVMTLLNAEVMHFDSPWQHQIQTPVASRHLQIKTCVTD